jgi:hypothetical protein
MVLADNNGSSPSGAYGFRLVLTEPETALPDLVPLSGEEQIVTVTCRLASATTSLQRVEDHHVALLTRQGTGILVDGNRLAVELLAPVPLSGEALVHPVLTIPLSILARWRGDVTLHGGAFFHAGAAWGVIGERTAGKSSMLGVLGDRGVPIVADDLLVIDDGWARAGPRCVDLRPDVAPYLPAARDLGVVGTRPRFRLSTPAAPARAPLGGMFVLDWHDAEEAEIVPVPTWERLRILYRQEAIALLGFAEPAAFVQLLEFPMWRLRRRRDWAATPGAVERLLAAAEDQARP